MKLINEMASVLKKTFKGLILTKRSIVLELCVERGICTGDVECNLRGETIILYNLYRRRGMYPKWRDYNSI